MYTQELLGWMMKVVSGAIYLPLIKHVGGDSSNDMRVGGNCDIDC